MADAAKPKPQTIRLLDPDTGIGQWILREKDALVARHHEHLRSARIEVAWKLNWSEDGEGNTPLGKTVLVSELFWRLLANEDGEEGVDFVLLLNDKLWDKLEEPQQRYILDELLCYCGETKNKDGGQAEDETGRLLWRLNKPEFAGFSAPVARHGAQLRRIKAFMGRASRGKQLAIWDDDNDNGAERTISKKDLPPAPAPAAGAREPVPPVNHYYSRVDNLFGDGDDYALRFAGADKRPEDVSGAFALTPPQTYVGTVDFPALGYNADSVTLRRCKSALRLMLEEKNGDVRPDPLGGANPRREPDEERPGDEPEPEEALN